MQVSFVLTRPIMDPLTPADLTTANNFMLWLAMGETRKLDMEGKLDSLAVFWEDNICWTQGRIGEDDLAKILKQKKLAVISNKTRYAELILTHCHAEDHRSNGHDAVWRSRRYCWMVRGQDLAKRVISNCFICKRNSKKMLEQRMGDLVNILFDADSVATFDDSSCKFLLSPSVIVACNRLLILA